MRDSDSLKRAYIGACLDELDALKPGNVHRFAPGHRMIAADFKAAARASAPFMTADLPIGARILKAAKASMAMVGQNANLGIILLCAPIAKAAQRGERLQETLAALSVEDANAAFQAIAHMNPAGLGEAAHDVREAARVTLLEAMREAAGYDRIAAAYVNDYAEIFQIALPALRQTQGPARWRRTAAYMALLCAAPDSHIARKHGAAAARRTQEQAQALAARGALETPQKLRRALMRFDANLKQDGLNPGTCADLAVAAYFIERMRGYGL